MKRLSGEDNAPALPFGGSAEARERLYDRGGLGALISLPTIGRTGWSGS